MLAFPILWRLYRRARRRSEPSFSDRALAVLGISYAAQGTLDEIPAAGPAIVVANHPFGALDGLIFASLLTRHRPDVRLLANAALERLPEMRAQLLPVNPFGGRAATHRNVGAMRAAVRWLRNGGCLCVFPAGTVSYVQRPLEEANDPAWHPSVIRLARSARAPIVPCFIEGQNSRLFQHIGRIHPLLRTLLLPRELLRKRGSRVQVHIGRAIDVAEIARDRDDTAAVGCLRERAYALAPTAHASVRQEVAMLPPAQTLVRTDSWSVFWMRAAQAPALMREIGRERETAFRAVKEGTGRDIDVDAFDERYLHLCLWDLQRDQLAGAYRMHPIEAWSGGQPSELYTQTLFRFDRRLTTALAPAIELGRAFVRPAYQKQHAALALLWVGIGSYIAQHRRYRHLFGALSIGPTYSSAARQVMVDYLRHHAWQPELAALVVARNPPRTTPIPSLDDVTDATMLNAAVSGADAEGKGIPVLLRQYLKLQARAIGFNIDASFGHVLDALLVVDLTRAPEAILGRYMGRDQAREYLAYHRRRGVSDTGEAITCRRSA